MSQIGVLDVLFDRAVVLPADLRAQFVADSTRGSATLRAELESLLSAHDRAAHFLEADAVVGEVAASLWHPNVPEQVGRYRIEGRIGSGGMGRVYAAVDQHGRRVALKLLARGHRADGRDVARFRREARTLLALNHPNVVTVHDVGTDGDVHFIASELVEGETLRALLRDDRIGIDRGIDICIQVAEALEASHRIGVVHRDIKPENVMVRADERVKVLDYGIAKRLEGEGEGTAHGEAHTRTGALLGTVSYMSPEQVRGADVDARTDIWSFGVLLYELVTQHRPFEAESQADVIAAILGAQPPPLQVYLEKAPPALQQIVSKTLCKQVEQRYQTIAAVLQDLRALATDMAFLDRISRRDFPDVDALIGAAWDVQQRAPGASRSGWRRRILWASGIASLAFVTLLLSLLVPAAMPQRSIELVPFTSRARTLTEQRIATALSEAVSTDLTEHRQLKVTVDRDESFLAGMLSHLRQRVGSSSSYRLDGSVLSSSPGGLQVVVHLERVRDGQQLWARDFALAKDGSDIPSIARGIALRAYQRSDVDVLLADARRQTRNGEAYAHYERAFLVWRDDETELSSVRSAEMHDNVRKAIQLDPTFPEPYRLNGLLLSGHDLAAAERSVRRYLQLRPESALGYADLGAYQMMRRQLTDADRSLRRARELDPNIAWPYVGAAHVAMLRGRGEEALSYWREAMALDGSVSAGRWEYAMTLLAMRYYDEADRQFDTVMRIDSTMRRQCETGRAAVALRRGDTMQFRARFEHAWSEFGATAPNAFLELLPAAGKGDVLRSLMTKWNSEAPAAHAVDRFRAYYALGELDAAVEWLNYALDHRQLNFATFLRLDGLWPGLRTARSYDRVRAKLDSLFPTR